MEKNWARTKCEVSNFSVPPPPGRKAHIPPSSLSRPGRMEPWEDLRPYPVNCGGPVLFLDKDWAVKVKRFNKKKVSMNYYFLFTPLTDQLHSYSDNMSKFPDLDSDSIVEVGAAKLVSRIPRFIARSILKS